ncbi:PEP-CTERM sorting domain-containing protein [Sphingomonas sp. CFBP 8760]|nr:PEP-CTERM sorting domain-containing protein [Sphingomonas sp. CFBP 8760]
MTLEDTSSDHAFTASVCAPSGVNFNGFTTASFGIRGCDATVALSLQDYRGGGTSYSGKIVEFRSYLIEASNQPLGYLGIGAVPEPATWAMMLIGFGMIGATARYRRRATKIAFA